MDHMYSWNAPEIAKAASVAAQAGQPMRTNGLKPTLGRVRKTNPCLMTCSRLLIKHAEHDENHQKDGSSFCGMIAAGTGVRALVA